MEYEPSEKDQTIATTWLKASNIVRSLQSASAKEAWNAALEKAVHTLQEQAAQALQGPRNSKRSASDASTKDEAVRILEALRELFGARGADRLSTVQILHELNRRAENASKRQSGFATVVDARKLASSMKQYDVAPVSVFIDGATTKGYVTYSTPKQGGLAQAWEQHLPPGPVE